MGTVGAAGADLAAMADAWGPTLRRASALTGVAEHVLLAMAAAIGGPGGPPWESVLRPDPGDGARAAALAGALSPSRAPAFAAAYALRHDPAAWLRAIGGAGWHADPDWPAAAAGLLEAAARSVLAPSERPRQPYRPAEVLDAASVARLALQHFPADAAHTMVAIAAAASAFDPFAAGAPHGGYAERDLVRRLSAASPSAARPLPDAGAPPYTAFGLWQIPMPSYTRALVRLTGTADPAAWACWLLDPAHNAVMARTMWDGRQKFAAWPQYVSGAHRPHMEAAAAAVAEAS